MRVLLLTHRLPYAPNRGDRLRAYHMLRTMRGQCEVDLFSLVHDDEEQGHVAEMRSLASTVVTARVPPKWRSALRSGVRGWSRPLTHTLLDSPDARPRLAAHVAQRRPDVVLSYCSGVAPLAMDPALAHVPLVVDMVDVDSEKWRGLASGASFPMSWVFAREARYLSRYEAFLTRRAHTTFVVNERERVSLAALAPDARIMVLPNGVDAETFRAPADLRRMPNVVFCGVMDYQPNVAGVLWFVREVWPAVRARSPQSVFTIVGMNPTAEIRALASSHPAVRVTGKVEDVRPYLWEAAHR